MDTYMDPTETLQHKDYHCSTKMISPTQRQQLQYRNYFSSAETTTAVQEVLLQHRDYHCSTEIILH